MDTVNSVPTTTAVQRHQREHAIAEPKVGSKKEIGVDWAHRFDDAAREVTTARPNQAAALRRPERLRVALREPGGQGTVVEEAAEVVGFGQFADERRNWLTRWPLMPSSSPASRVLYPRRASSRAALAV